MRSKRLILCVASFLVCALFITCMPVTTYAASKKLPRAKITKLESYAWYDSADWSYSEDEEYTPKHEYYDSDRDDYYIMSMYIGCRKEKGDVKYQFAVREGKKGKWNKFSYGKDRTVSWFDIPKNKTVYVKVRTYKEKNGKRKYGKWSPIVKESSHFKDIDSVSAYARNGYIKGYIRGAFKGETIKVKIGKKIYSTKVKKTSKKYKFKIGIGKHDPGKKVHIILCSPVGSKNLDYTYTLWYAKNVKVGFTKKQVRWTWGSPSSKSSSSGGWSYWHYDDGSYVDFKNGRVKYWYDAAG